MAKSMIINVNVDNINACAYVTYSSGTEKTYPADRLPKTVQAWIEAHTEEPEIIKEQVIEEATVEQEAVQFEQEVVRDEQAVVQAVVQAPKTPRPRIINTSDVAWLSYVWDLETLLLILIRAGLIGTVWILEGTAKALPVIRAVITETVAVIKDVTGWIFEGVDLVKEAVVYVGALL